MSNTISQENFLRGTEVNFYKKNNKTDLVSGPTSLFAQGIGQDYERQHANLKNAQLRANTIYERNSPILTKDKADPKVMLQTFF